MSTWRYCNEIWNHYMDNRDGMTSSPPPIISGVTKADTSIEVDAVETVIDRIYEKNKKESNAMYRWFNWSVEVKEDEGGCTDFEGRIWAKSAFEAHDKVWANIKNKYNWVREENVDLFEVVYLTDDDDEYFIISKVKHYDEDGID